jgi:hypothetical protein
MSDIYPGTYLKEKPFEERYRVIAEQLPDTSEMTIVDINCGEPLFSKYVKFKRYVCNDIYTPDNTEGLEFYKVTDTEIDVKPDILCIWGYGGGEHTGQPLESATAGKTILRLAQYNPQYIILEMARKWENDFKIMSNLKSKLEGYEEVFAKNIDIEPVGHYHDQRQVSLLKKIVV